MWEVGPDLKSGALSVVLPEYRGSSKVAVYAVYPSRDDSPAKAHAFVEFLAKRFRRKPDWEQSTQQVRYTEGPARALRARLSQEPAV